MCGQTPLSVSIWDKKRYMAEDGEGDTPELRRKVRRSAGLSYLLGLAGSASRFLLEAKREELVKFPQPTGRQKKGWAKAFVCRGQVGLAEHSHHPLEGGGTVPLFSLFPC